MYVPSQNAPAWGNAFQPSPSSALGWIEAHPWLALTGAVLVGLILGSGGSRR
jgi:hypothetical protein